MLLRVTLQLLRSEDGGRPRGIANGYRPGWRGPRKPELNDAIVVFDAGTVILPGAAGAASLIPIAPALWEGRVARGERLDMLEGSRCVGAADILSLEPDGTAPDPDTGIEDNASGFREKEARYQERLSRLARELDIHDSSAQLDAPMTFDDALDAIFAHHRRPAFTAANEPLREAIRLRSIQHRDFWFVDVGWIGCIGHFVERRTGYVEAVGSMLDLDECLWARSRGISPSSTDLVIEAYAAEIATKLGHVLELEPLPSAPFSVLGVMLGLELKFLRNATERGQLAFRAARSSVPANRQRGGRRGE